MPRSLAGCLTNSPWFAAASVYKLVCEKRHMATNLSLDSKFIDQPFKEARLLLSRIETVAHHSEVRASTA
jgi:hypothetical protein